MSWGAVGGLQAREGTGDGVVSELEGVQDEAGADV